MNPKILIILFCLSLAAAGFFFYQKSFNFNAYYDRGMQQNFRVDREQQAEEAERGDEEKSNEPQAPGFKESEVKKYRGDRFYAY